MVAYNLRSQRRIAAAVLGVGKRRVWMDPRRAEDLSVAMTRSRITKLVKERAVSKRELNCNTRSRFRRRLNQKRKGRHSGPGLVRGCHGARVPKKDIWMLRIRGLRRMLKKYRDSKKIDCHMYHSLYLRCKGNQYKNKRFLIEAVFAAKSEDEKQKALQVQQQARQKRSKVLLAKKAEGRQRKLH